MTGVQTCALPIYKAFNNLGAAFLEIGQLEPAERCFRKAIELFQGYVAAWNNLGIVTARQGLRDNDLARLQEARRYMQRALKLNPAFPDAEKNVRYVDGLIKKSKGKKENGPGT